MKLPLVGVLVALVACQSPGPPPPTSPDASATVDPACSASCAHLVAIGCTEGVWRDCAATCFATKGTPIASVDWACADRATSKAQAQACGPRFCTGLGPR